MNSNGIATIIEKRAALLGDYDKQCALKEAELIRKRGELMEVAIVRPGTSNKLPVTESVYPIPNIAEALALTLQQLALERTGLFTMPESVASLDGSNPHLRTVQEAARKPLTVFKANNAVTVAWDEAVNDNDMEHIVQRVAYAVTHYGNNMLYTGGKYTASVSNERNSTGRGR